MTPLRKDAEKAPVSHIAIVTLLAIGLVSLPLGDLFKVFMSDALTAALAGGIIIRAVFTAVAAVFIVKYGYQKAFTANRGVKGYVAVLPALIVAINNFPIIGVFCGNVVITATATQTVLYLIYCLSVGFYEEFVFRGIVFPLCLKITENKKKGAFLAIALSSAIFGGAHIINLFGGAGAGATFLQVGYSFLIGAMCAISLCVTGNLFVAAILHFIYDIGGLLVSNVGIAYGNQWDLITVIITAVLGVAVFIYMTVTALKTDYSAVYASYRT